MTIPPLRQRGEDVLLLAEYFLEKFSREFNKPGLRRFPTRQRNISSTAIAGRATCANCENHLERAVILADGLIISAEELQIPASKPGATALPRWNAAAENFQLGWFARRHQQSRCRSHLNALSSKAPCATQVGTKPAPPNASASHQKPCSRNCAPSASNSRNERVRVENISGQKRLPGERHLPKRSCLIWQAHPGIAAAGAQLVFQIGQPLFPVEQFDLSSLQSWHLDP